MKLKYTATALLVLMSASACEQEREATPKSTKPAATAGSIERLSPKLDALIATGAKLEILGEGYRWSEGPVWVEKHNMLLFSDVPSNTVYRWTSDDGVSEYLKPSGYTGNEPRGADPGSNGLVLGPHGDLVLCQHGNRQVARMAAPLDNPAPQFVTLADTYQGKRFNSPNDAAYHSSGALYFTDPPYGLANQGENNPEKELDFNGVFRLSPDGEVRLLYKELTRPNGIAFSPDEKTLYVANSDPGHAVWMAFDVTSDGGVENPRVFFDVTGRGGGAPGLPDGLKVDDAGNLYATGPGGVLVFSPRGEHLGTVNTGKATANVAFNTDKSVLYITAHDTLMRLALR